MLRPAGHCTVCTYRPALSELPTSANQNPPTKQPPASLSLRIKLRYLMPISGPVTLYDKISRLDRETWRTVRSLSSFNPHHHFHTTLFSCSLRFSATALALGKFSMHLSAPPPPTHRYMYSTQAMRRCVSRVCAPPQPWTAARPQGNWSVSQRLVTTYLARNKAPISSNKKA